MLLVLGAVSMLFASFACFELKTLIWAIRCTIYATGGPFLIPPDRIRRVRCRER